jgi:hypothetical protein
MLIQPRNGDHFDRRQTEKELLEALSLKNEEISVLHQVSTFPFKKTLVWLTNWLSYKKDSESTQHQYFKSLSDLAKVI